MSAQDEIGPRMATRMQIYQAAREVEELARLARELCAAGPHQDMPRARKCLDKARALLGSATVS